VCGVGWSVFATNLIGGFVRPPRMKPLRLPLLGLAALLALLLTGAGIAQAASDGTRPAAGAGLVGRWLPADGRADGRAFVELEPDGHWTGSDGCNRTKGTWQGGPDGRFAATSGPSTMIGCENVPIATWLADAARADVDGETLVLRDATGAETGRLVRLR
jgi:heat shock protein HslJ